MTEIIIAVITLIGGLTVALFTHFNAMVSQMGARLDSLNARVVLLEEELDEERKLRWTAEDRLREDVEYIGILRQHIYDQKPPPPPEPPWEEKSK